MNTPRLVLYSRVALISLCICMLLIFSPFEGNSQNSLEAIGDTLTIIQKPLLNIPEIVVPGEEFMITCVAPSSTTNWQAELIHGAYTIELPISSAAYKSNLDRWHLTANAPMPEIFELFDLKVSATGIEDDISEDAIQLIEEEKDSYYFIHITDTHLPTQFYYEDPQSLTDTSEMADLWAVIHDINLINPEFVLITGDYINEGELEDLEARRYYTKAQRMLTKFDIPVYLVSGNHDIGGWVSTPAPQGTARRDWWRFFGWKWLQDPPQSDPLYTQNYGFYYGNTHYIGMEAYLNYDEYMYPVYGEESFLEPQLQWLRAELLTTPDEYRKVIFYHNDFKDQINLSTIEADMALYGHIHHNSGNISNPPYNLATDNVCNGDRAYRMVRVNAGSLQPTETLHAGWTGGNLSVNYSPANNGQSDSITAQILNQHNQAFEHGRLKFKMPPGDDNYTVENGVLQQVDRSGEYNICYVDVVIPASGLIRVKIKAFDLGIGVQGIHDPEDFKLYQNFPNPYTNKTTIRYYLPHADAVHLWIYDMSGKLVSELVNERQDAGAHSVVWDISAESSGAHGTVLFCRLHTDLGIEKSIKLVRIP